MTTSPPCPCGSGGRLDRCCGPLLDGQQAAPSALALMRSRYTAWVLERHDYLLATWHPDTRPGSLPAPTPGLRWLGLEVRSAASQGDDAATVEFVARSKLDGRAHRMREKSRFVREGGRWYYVDAEGA